MVNNVTVLGHAHPRVADTAARQLRKLNTNSRFNYEAVVEFSERLAATLPDPLDTVFLVNSGSEASDLAIRLATAATGRRDVVAVREAYHGWTYGTDAVSTSTADNPNALATRPDWVHTVESPNSFRGKYRGAEAGRYAGRGGAADRGTDRRRPSARGVHLRERVRQCGRHGAAGRLPAAGVCGGARRRAVWRSPTRSRSDTAVSANGSGVSTQQNVVPDIVSIAKSTGNGYPLGAVITSRAVADAFRVAGLLLLVDRRQPAVVRDRHHRPRRAARRGACRRTPRASART